MTTIADRLRGLYAITDPRYGRGKALLSHVDQALQGGTRMVQYRDKGADTTTRLAEAEGLRRLCSDHGALLLINDDINLAITVGADGVHLGRDDSGLQPARERLGEQAIIGVSCYNRLALAQEAAAAGADYVAFGRFYPSTTKPEAVQAEPGLLTEARTRLHIPLVAIGGITADNGALLVEHGADALAVIDGLFGQADIRAAALRLAALYSHDNKR